MKLPRRQFLHLAAGAVALPALSRFAWAQAYPTRPVRLIEGFGAGGAADIVARLIGQSLSERLGQSFVIENRSGAASNIATEAVVRAPADGYTLLLVTAPNAINATLYDRLSFNFIRDIAPVAAIVHAPLVMEVHPSFPARTVAEFMAGLDLLHVPYRGAQVFPALLAGDVPQVYFGPLLSSIEYVRTGKLRALAVTATTRSPMLPDIPALSETLPGYEASTWFGVGAPKATPAEIVNKLNKEINAALDDPKMKARLADLGGTPLPGSPAEFGKLIAEETEKWGKVIRAANIKPQG